MADFVPRSYGSIPEGWGRMSPYGMNTYGDGITLEDPLRRKVDPSGPGTPLDFNIGTGQLIFGGLQAAGNFMNSFQANSMAKKQFEFTKNFANTNLANQLKSYNTRLEDKAVARGVTQNEAPGWAEAYVSKNRLTRDSIA